PGMREPFKKDINLTTLKEWKEAGKLFEEDDEILNIYNYSDHLKSTYANYDMK
ncbi:438_t:CDS:1, partial [Rhizophagus irregularis]